MYFFIKSNKYIMTAYCWTSKLFLKIHQWYHPANTSSRDPPVSSLGSHWDQGFFQAYLSGGEMKWNESFKITCQIMNEILSNESKKIY